MADLIDIASKEVGYKESTGNKTKYGVWYGMNGAKWCHIFVSWCAYKAGVSQAIVPKTASTTDGMNFYKQHSRFGYKGKYTPKRNDLIYFKTGASHVGIVEKCENGKVYTIEGNSSNKVQKRSYSLNHGTITGYGKVHDYITNSNSSSTTPAKTTTTTKPSTGSSSSAATTTKQNTEKDVSQELAQLRAILAQTDKPQQKLQEYQLKTVEAAALTVRVQIVHNNQRYLLAVQEGMTITWERKNTPGKLTLSVIWDTVKPLWVGDHISVYVNNQLFFTGWVFTFKPTTDHILSVTAYDQLRYFKNKDTYIYSKKSSTDLLRMIAKDFGLKVGTTDNSKYPITRMDDDLTLFDIMQNSLDETLLATGKIYSLIDRCGALVLREPWKTDILIDENTGQSYDYTCSIDNNYYNQIKLAYENKETGTLDLYVSKSQTNINRFGVLQYFEKIDSPKLGKLKGEVLLRLYNHIPRTLKISGVIGSTKVVAGCLVGVLMDLYDIKVSGYMLVDKVTHTFKNNEHWMDVSLSGGVMDGQ